MSRRRSPSRVRDLLGEVGARLGLQDAVATGGLWSNWADIVGARVAAHAEPTSLRSGVLRVRVSSPTWATEISYFAPEIVRRANEAAGNEIVREIKVWTGPAPTAGSAAEPASASVEARPADTSDTQRDAGAERATRDPMEALESAHRAWVERRSAGRRDTR